MNKPAENPGAVNASWGATVGTTIALQWAVILILSGVAFLLGGARAALSLFCGGAAVAVPNALLAGWLTLRVLKTGSAGAAAMLGGELLKLCLTLALIVIVAVQFKPVLSWLALIAGVVGALKAQWLAVWVTSRAQVPAA